LKRLPSRQCARQAVPGGGSDDGVEKADHPSRDAAHVQDVCRAAAVGESSIYLQKGDRLTVGELVEAALIQSANDAAVALAEHVGGSQAAFVGMMNAEAAKLGLRDTHFANPDGLDASDHYSSAHDVTRLARIAMKNPEIRRSLDPATASCPKK